MLRQPCRRRFEHRLRKDQAVGDDDRDVGVERGEVRLRLGCSQRLRMTDGKAQRFGPEVDRRGAVLLAPPGGARGLGVDRGDLVPRGGQRVERGDREVRRAHEDDPHEATFRARLSTMSRFSFDRRSM
jgi:hypothetical protein